MKLFQNLVLEFASTTNNSSIFLQLEVWAPKKDKNLILHLGYLKVIKSSEAYDTHNFVTKFINNFYDFQKQIHTAIPFYI